MSLSRLKLQKGKKICRFAQQYMWHAVWVPDTKQNTPTLEKMHSRWQALACSNDVSPLIVRTTQGTHVTCLSVRASIASQVPMAWSFQYKDYRSFDSNLCFLQYSTYRLYTHTQINRQGFYRLHSFLSSIRTRLNCPEVPFLRLSGHGNPHVLLIQVLA